MAAQATGTDLFAQVNKPKDMAAMTDLEKKHLPVIEAPDSVAAGACFQVTVEVGKLLAHPNEHAHFIEYIDLYQDQVLLARADLSAVKTCPKVTFAVAVSKGGKLRAFASCNLHGIWEGNKPIAVA
jgi:superoxide reductase